ncbi:MAG TPA: hypothetical protein O0X25_02105 [Methanocorpusculum sp.]|nr:hypothetical protein [Methanocorpusculum sp.]HJJ39785.1 hypothetical protein [Methanocorpusculum sp.]HJJ49395.1 hypothetical protein [Methanocorpusculum sp.]HJJ57531.1 hypothetical protein [Methanocorpusculum sp.]
MDEIAKTEARNYLTAAGFFVLGAEYILNVILMLTGLPMVFPNVDLIAGIGLILISVLLIVLRKRDMIAILFTMIGLAVLFSSYMPLGAWYVLTTGFILLTALVTLTSKDKQKWLLFILPVLGFVLYLIVGMGSVNLIASDVVKYSYVIIGLMIAVLSFFYAFVCASEWILLPGRNLLTADEETDFRASGSVLGYILFAFIIVAWAVYNLVGESLGLTLTSMQTLELLCAVLLILVSLLLFFVGKMRFTPVMFFLMALTVIFGIYSTDAMSIGLGALFIIIGLFALLREESRILPGIMNILYGVMFFIMWCIGGYGVPTMVFGIIEIVVAAISVYLAFVVYSQRNLPKF